MKTSFVFTFRGLQEVLVKTYIFALALRLQKKFSRRLGQDQSICLGHTSSRHLQDVSNTSSRRLQYVQPRRFQDVFKTFYKNVFKTSSRHFEDTFKMSSRHLQDVLKTPSRCLQDMFKTSYQDVFKTSSKRLQDLLQKSLQDIFQTSSRHLENVLQRYLQEVFKKYHQVKLFLLTHLREVFNTFLKHSFPKTVIYRGVCRGKTTSEKFIVSVQIFQER